MTASTRLKIGLSLAVGGNVLFFSSAWIAWMPWSASFKATLLSVLFFASETATLICVAMIGRENYERFKNGLFNSWRKWRGENDPELVPIMVTKANHAVAVAGDESCVATRVLEAVV